MISAGATEDRKPLKKKSQASMCPSRDTIQVPPDYKSNVLQPLTCSVTQCEGMLHNNRLQAADTITLAANTYIIFHSKFTSY